MEDNHKHVSTSEVLASYYNIVDSDPPPLVKLKDKDMLKHLFYVVH